MLNQVYYGFLESSNLYYLMIIKFLIQIKIFFDFFAGIWKHIEMLVTTFFADQLTWVKFFKI